MRKGVESGTRDLYEVLEVSPAADDAEIRAAFRRLAAKYHPDRNSTPNAAIHFKRVNAAYQVLGDPERRAAYDALTGQVDPPPDSSTDPMVPFTAPAPAPEGWYLDRNGNCMGPVRPEMVVNWIANGLREGMVRFGAAGEWHPLTQSVFARFIPQTIPPPMPDPSLPPPQLRFVSDADLGRRGSSRALKVVAVLTVLVAAIVAGVFFVPRASFWKRWRR